jgi:putative ABC transport system permease protein
LDFDLEIPEKNYPKSPDVMAFWERVQARLRSAPGVASVSVATGAPLRRRVALGDVLVEDDAAAPPQRGFVPYRQLVTHDYFATMGVRVLEGRAFDAREVTDPEHSVIVNETFARGYFPSGWAVGKRVYARPWTKSAVPQTIVGVAADVKQKALDVPTAGDLYVPFGQGAKTDMPPRHATLLVRASGAPDASLDAIRAAVASVDPNVPMVDYATMDGLLWGGIARQRLLTMLLGALALIALVMAMVGIYGVTTHSVEQRTRELGIRMALGAPPLRVLGLIVAQGLGLAVTGLLLGIGAAVAMTSLARRAFASLLLEGTSLDAPTYAALAAVIAAVATLASYLPALRATRIPPTTAMRGM